DAYDCLDRAASLHQSRDAAAFDRGGEEGRDRAFLAIGVAQPDHQRAEQTRHNDETHVATILSQPFAILSEASTHAFGRWRQTRPLRLMPDTPALRHLCRDLHASNVVL